MAKIVELIYTEDRRGLGQREDDPIRLCPQLWTKDGKRVAELDDHKRESFFNGL